MNPDQTQLLHKLQLIRHPAFLQINPAVMGEEEAADYLKQNLPLLEYQTAVGITPEREFVEKVFWGVSEYDCKKQIDRWIEENDYILDHRPNPYFASGIDWLKYFAQPVRQVNLASLEKHFSDWEMKIPKETWEVRRHGQDGAELVRKETFSRLELGFDDVDPEKLLFAVEQQKQRDLAEMFRITPEQRLEIKALQALGKAPVLDRDAYLKMDRKDAAAYLARNRDNPEDTYPRVSYEKETPQTKDEAFPEYRPANLLSQPPADYLQRSVLRDLVAEGHLAAPETRREFLEKLPYITREQAAALIAPHEHTPAGAGLIEQCRAYCDFGGIHTAKAVRTIADVCTLYRTNRCFDPDLKAALRDLVDDGVIQSPDAKAKIDYLSEAMASRLLSRFGDAPMGGRLRTKLMDMMTDHAIGGMEDEQFRKLTVREAMQIIAGKNELDRFKHPVLATEKQKEVLRTMAQLKQIDLSQVDLKTLTVRKAHELIGEQLQRQAENAQGPATERQRALLKALIRAGATPVMPYAEWKNLTKQAASELIRKVPEAKRKEIMEAPRPESSPAPEAVSRTAPGQGRDMQ